jgi:hypothetical protein
MARSSSFSACSSGQRSIARSCSVPRETGYSSGSQYQRGPSFSMSTSRSSATLKGPPLGPGRIVWPGVGSGDGPEGAQAAMDSRSTVAIGRIRPRVVRMSRTAR